MVATQVQSKSAAQDTGLATVTVSWNTPATAGNLLIIAVCSDDYRTAGGIPSGFTESTGCAQQGNNGLYFWWKVAAGGETSATYTIASASTSVWETYEYSGLDAAPYDISAGQVINSGLSSYTTPTLTPTAGDRLIAALIGGSSSAGNFTSLGSWTNSFVAQLTVTNTKASGTRDIEGLATRAVTADGATGYSTGATYSQNASGRTAIIISFKVAAAGGTTQNAAATLAATASLSVDAPKTTLPAAALAATATVTAAATDTISPAVTLAATATLTPAATDTITAAASVPVTATLSTTLTTGAAPKLADTTLAVTATLSAAAARTAAAAALDATATLTTAVSLQRPAAVAVAVVAALAPGAMNLRQAGAALAVTAALVADAVTSGATANASSAPTVTAAYGSTPGVTAHATSAATATGRAASTPSVSDG